MARKKILEENVVLNEEPVIEETNENVKSDNNIRIGKVARCASLNIREKPSIKSSPLCVVLNNADLVIDLEYKNREWYKVCIENGIEGFCLKEYVD